MHSATRLTVFFTLVVVAFSIKCYSGMQGAVNGDSIGQLEILDCNATEFCVKLPSTGHVGRKLYEGAQYSCSYGECSKDGCFNSGIGEICCCSEDECNFTQTKNFLAFYVILFLFLAIFGY